MRLNSSLLSENRNRAANPDVHIAITQNTTHSLIDLAQPCDEIRPDRQECKMTAIDSPPHSSLAAVVPSKPVKHCHHVFSKKHVSFTKQSQVVNII